MLKKKTLLISVVLILALAMFGSGCTNPFSKGKESPKEPLVLYYVNKAYVEEENTKNIFVEYEADMPALPKELGNASVDEQVSFRAVSALNFLKEVPAAISDEAVSMLGSELVINNVTVKEGTAVVDLSVEQMENVAGYTGESLLISQIVKTLRENFDEVKKVQFMVNGEVVDSLMGHVDVSEPFVAPPIR